MPPSEVPMPSRVVRAEFNTSESLARCSLPAQLLFVKLLLVADDYGRFDGRPRAIRTACFGFQDDITDAMIASWLKELTACDPDGTGPIMIYPAPDGKPIICFVNWERHRSNGKRGAISKWPAPACDEPVAESPRSPRVPEESAGPRPGLGSRVSGSGGRVSGGGLEEKEHSPAASGAEAAPPAPAEVFDLQPLIRLLTDLGADPPPEPDERAAWLAEIGPELEPAALAEAIAMCGTPDPPRRQVNAIVKKITLARWRTYLRGPRVHRDAANRRQVGAAPGVSQRAIDLALSRVPRP